MVLWFHGRDPRGRFVGLRSRVSDAERELEYDEHQVTPLELFFDLVFVFAITQVTRLLAQDPTWGGVFRGMLVLAASGGRGAYTRGCRARWMSTRVASGW
jgi:hypothetical protein